jgi:hypothetical protein
MPRPSGQSDEADPSKSSRIFISYRRDDSAGHVLALVPALRNHFGADRIFKDTESIPVGVNYREFISRVLNSCSVMLAIIGRDWLTIQDAKLKTRRLDNPEDPLRFEVTTALKNERIRVIPVLVDRGVMPSPEDLPADLAEFHFLNALELSDTRWESDVQRLIQAIEEAAPAPVQRTQGPVSPQIGRLQTTRAVLPQLNQESHPIELIPTDPASLTFTGAHHKRLAEAFEKAFPTYQDLEMMVRYRLGLNLESVVARVNKLSYVTFELVRTQVAAGLLLRLIAAARASQPDNPQLALVSEQFGLALATPRSELAAIVKSTGVPFDVAVWRERLAKRERCVCRIDVRTDAGTSHGSGFLVGPDLVLTNHHVIAPALALGQDRSAPAENTAESSSVIVRFDYKALDDGTTIHPGLEVGLAEDWLVDASPHSRFDLQGLPKEGVPDPGELDHALIRLSMPVGELPVSLGEAEPGAKDRGWIELHSEPWPFGDHTALFIIQHPRSAPMKLALDFDARMQVNANATRVLYQTKTEEGSSGSPCFNESWDVVALHHAGDASYEGFYDPAFNEGIPISTIVERLRARDATSGLTIV